MKKNSPPVFFPESPHLARPATLVLLGVQFFGRGLLLGLPQVAGDGDGVHAGGHRFGRDQAELLPVRVVLVQALDHLDGDALRPDAGQFGDLLRLRAVGVHGPELAPGVTEQQKEVIGFGFLHFLHEESGREECWFAAAYLMQKNTDTYLQNVHQVSCSSALR